MTWQLNVKKLNQTTPRRPKWVTARPPAPNSLPHGSVTTPTQPPLRSLSVSALRSSPTCLQPLPKCSPPSLVPPLAPLPLEPPSIGAVISRMVTALYIACTISVQLPSFLSLCPPRSPQHTLGLPSTFVEGMRAGGGSAAHAHL